MNKQKTTGAAANAWTTPRLSFVGRVADILQSGGGKLSITAADPGEMRCEKPHADQCVPA
jgi:hypothetical protein